MVYEAVLIAFVVKIPAGAHARTDNVRLAADLRPGAPGCPDYTLAVQQLDAAHAGAGNCRSGRALMAV